MKKVCILTPPLSLEQRYGVLAGGGSAAPSLGILMLAAVTRDAGFDCTVVDASALALSSQELLQRLQIIRPDIICISSTTLAITNAHAVAVEAHRMIPSLTVLVGGPHVTAAPHETLTRFPAFDIAITGEGESTLVELLGALDAGRPLIDIQGLVYREGDLLRDTGRRAFITDLDSLPFPAWDLLEGFPGRYTPAPFKVRKLPAATLVTTRGCPNACIFCDRSVFGSSCHAHSAEYVIRQISELYHHYGVREFSFEDDTFILAKDRLQEICTQLIELRLNISWTCLARVNLVTEDMLRLMHTAGCWQVSYGIESGSPEILACINKGVTLDQIRRAVGFSRAAGLKTKGFFILGHPGETALTLRQTIQVALELPLDDISVCFMTPFPGTELHGRAAEYGELDPDWERMNLLNPVFIAHGLHRCDLEAAQREMIRRFYFRPRVVLDYARRFLLNPSMARGLWTGLRSLCRSIAA